MQRNLLLKTIVDIVVGLAELVLAFRIVLRLFAADPTAPFVHWIYTTSDSLLVPFRGIFTNPVIDRGYVLDFTALFALIVYGIIGYLMLYAVEVLTRSLVVPTSSVKKNR